MLCRLASGVGCCDIEAILIPDPFSMWPIFFLRKPVVIHVFVLMLLYWELKWVLPFFIEV